MQHEEPAKPVQKKKENGDDPRLAVLFPKRLTSGQRVRVGILAAFTVFSSTLLWMCYHTVLAIGLTHALWWIILSFLSLFLFVALVAIVALLVHERMIAWSIYILAILTHLIWFRYGWYSSIAVLLLVIGCLYYDWQIKTEESLRIRFSVSKSMRYGLSTTIALVLLAISLTFYGHSVAKQQLAGSSLSPLHEMAGNTVNQAIALQIPDYDPKETVDDLLYRLMTAQIKKQVEGEAQDRGVQAPEIDFSNPAASFEQLSNLDLSAIINELPPEIRSQVGDDPEALRQYIQDRGNAMIESRFVTERNKILSDLGVQAQGSTPVGEVVKQLVAKQLEKFLGPYEVFVPPLLALTVFFTLSIFIFLYAGFMKAFATLIFAIIKGTGFVKIQTIDAEVEVATLSD